MIKFKNTIINWFFIVISLFLLTISLLIFSTFTNKVSDVLESNLVELDKNSSTTEIMMTSTHKFINVFDLGFAFLFFGIAFFVIWGSSSLIAVSKVFIPIFLIVALITVLFSVQFSNAYESYIYSSEDMIQTAEDYPIMTFIMLKFPFFVFIISVLILVSSYAKTKGQQEFAI